jgi:hypothetical protein
MMRINSACGVVVGRLDEGESVRESGGSVE